MSIAANFIGQILANLLASVLISTANTNRDGSGTLGTIVTAPASGLGSRIEGIRVQAVGTTTAGMVRLYMTDGTNTRLFHEVPVSAITPSASVAAFAADVDSGMFPMVLPAGWSLKASTHNAESFNVLAKMAGNF